MKSVESKCDVAVLSHSRAMAELLIGRLGLDGATVFLLPAEAGVSDSIAGSRCQPRLALIVGGDLRRTLASLRALHSQGPLARLLVIGVPNRERAILRCMRAGAAGIVLAGEREDELSRAVDELRTSGVRLPAPILPSLVERLVRTRAVPAGRSGAFLLARLSAREIQILSCLAEKKTNKDIAAALYVSEQTVKNHVTRVLRKLAVGNRHDAARVAALHFGDAGKAGNARATLRLAK
jgi:DNA-binding NarL/FixJ family response regulator